MAKQHSGTRTKEAKKFARGITPQEKKKQAEVQKELARVENILQIQIAFDNAHGSNDALTMQETINNIKSSDPSIILKQDVNSLFNEALSKLALDAVELDYSGVVQLIIEKNLLQYIDDPILNIAISLGHNGIVGIVELLVPCIPLNDKCEKKYIAQGKILATKGYAPIHEAAKVGNIAALNAICKQHKKKVIKYYNDEGLTPFQVAIMHDQLEAAQCLVGSKAIADSVVKYLGKEYTVLCLASANKLAFNHPLEKWIDINLDILKLLIKNNATIDKLSGKFTALAAAVLGKSYLSGNNNIC